MKKLTVIFMFCTSILNGQSIASMKEFIEILRSEKKCDDAFALVESTLKTHPNNDTLHYYRGWLKINCLNDYRSAIRDFENALRHNPKSALGLLGLGTCLNNLRKPDSALNVLNQSLKTDPKNPLTQGQMGYAHYLLADSNHKHYSKAIQHFTKAIELDIQDMRYYLYRGISYYSLNKFKQADIDFIFSEEAGFEDSYLSEMYFYAGLNDYKMGYFDRAADRLTLCHSRDSLNPEVWLYRGFAQLKNGNMTEAMTDLNKYLTVKPNDPDIYFAIAEGYTYAEDMDMGHVYYDKAARFGHKKAQKIMEKYKASFVVHKKTQGIPVTFATDNFWSVDEFHDTPSVSSCNGMIFYSSDVKLTFAILENNELVTNPKSSCTIWEKELNQNGIVDMYRTSAYEWTRTISADTWTSEIEIYDIKVLKLTPNIPNNQILVYIWGKPEDVQAMDFYITRFLESIRIGQQ